jgi:hypothetical protein
LASQAERAAEERRGLIRWLRTEFQNPTGAKAATQENLATSDEPDDSATAPVAATAAVWPKKLAEQISAVRDLVTKGAAEWSKAEVAAAFKGANKADVEEVLNSLASLGISPPTTPAASAAGNPPARRRSDCSADPHGNDSRHRPSRRRRVSALDASTLNPSGSCHY